MKEPITNFATNRPKAVYWAVLALTLAAASQLPRIHIDTDPENMLSVDQEDRVFHNLVEEQFQLHDAIVVGIVNESHPEGIYNVDTLGRLHRLNQQILEIDGVVTPDLMSLVESDNITQTAAGDLRFEWMMREAPQTQAEATRIRDMAERLPLLMNTLVSGDDRAAAIYVPIESKDLSYSIARQIREQADVLGGGDDQFYVTGLPVAEDTFGVEMFVQMGISAPLAGLMIFLLMWYFFRSARLVIAPMLVAMMTVIITMGLLIGSGFTVHIMSSMIPIFLMPIAVVDSVHIMSEFVDRYDPERGRAWAVREVIDHLYKPMLFTSLTTAVGFSSLMLTPIPPVQIFGAFVAIGVLLAFALTIVFIPAYIVRMKPGSLARMERLHSRGTRQSPLARGLRAIGRFAFGHGKLVTGLAATLIAVSIAGVARIEINDNPVRWFKQDQEIRVADRILNEHFAGTYDAFLVLAHEDSSVIADFEAQAIPLVEVAESHGAAMTALRELMASPPASAGVYFDDFVTGVDDALFESDLAAEDTLLELMTLAETAQSGTKYFQSPDAIRMIERLQEALSDTGLVGKTNSFADVVKVVNRELRSGEAIDYQIPGSAAGVAQSLLQFQSSHRPQDLWHMVTPDFASTAIWLQLTSGDNQDMTRVLDAVDAYLADHPLPAGVQARWAGKTYINVVWQEAMVAGMLKSLLGAFVIVFFMMAVLFRSAIFGLLAMLPLSVTILAVYGLIGWIGKDYDMPIAVLSSLTLGLSVDFAIHFLQRMRTLHQQTGSFGSAAEAVFEEPARAIGRNAIVIAFGFTPLFLAPLVPYVTVGAFMASIMVVSALSTLVVLPAVLAWSQRLVFKQPGSASSEARGLIESRGV